ncbi:MAG: GIY-YIG nuclease family protein [Bacteroidetes bacterium]|nr:MAG: GIY-YIG nuclease family protein [Bacteroidota bacterium]
MFYAYVLESLSDSKYHYKGSCQDLRLRLLQHNGGKTKSNKAFAPFKVLHHEVFETRLEAVATEKYWKTAAGRRYLQRLITTGSVVPWIPSQTSQSDEASEFPTL